MINKITNIKKANAKLIKKSLACATLLTLGLSTAGCSKGKSNGSNNESTITPILPVTPTTTIESTVTPTVTVTPTPIVTVTPTVAPTTAPSVVLEGNRYTEITEEGLINASAELVEELKKNGIEVTSEEAMTFVVVANITHLEQTNPELAAKVFSEKPDAEATLTSVGHIIGKIVTLQMNSGITVDYTKAFIDETDRKIANYNVELINDLDKLLTNSTVDKKTKSDSFNKLVQEQYLDVEFSATKGYDFSDGTHTGLTQEDGADFITDGITTGMLFYGKNIKNYIKDGSEMHQDIDAIAANMDVVSNIQTMIEDCDATLEPAKELVK